ncbi:THO2 protein [Pelomyxa schiedti]|nr:THO2 protein [Pelomyxa schiedti]
MQPGTGRTTAECRIFPDGAFQCWESQGYNTAVEYLRGLNMGSEAPEFCDNIRQFYLELGNAVVTSELSTAQAISALQAEPIASPEAPSLLADVLWLIALKLDNIDDKNCKKLLIAFSKELIGIHAVSPAILKERMEPEFLEAMGWTTKKIYERNTIRVNASESMSHQKVMLLREEPAGYARLIAELDGGVTLAPETLSDLIFRVNSLIGTFDLDTNRVFDILLEVFEKNQQNKYFIDFIASLGKLCPLAQLLSVKFRSYQIPDSKETTPRSLYDLTARLLQAGRLTLEEIIPNLRPTESEMRTAHDSWLEQAVAAAKKLRSSYPSGHPVMDKRATRPTITYVIEGRVENQKLNLVESMLTLGDYPGAHHLLNLVTLLIPGAHQSINRLLCQKIHSLIEPYYRPLSPILPGKGETGISTVSIIPLCKEVLPLVRHLKCYLSSDVVLFCKLCRLLKEFLVLKGLDDGPKQIIYKVVKEVLLPSLSLIPSNPAVCIELWDLLMKIPYQQRYSMYNHLVAVTYKKYPPLIIAAAETMNDSKQQLKRLSAENVKMVGRNIGKFSHHNALISLGTLLDQVEVIAAMATVSIDALRNLTALSYDMLCYLIIEHVSRPRQKVKTDGVSNSQWLQGLSLFCGNVFSRYTTVPLEPLLVCVIWQLRDGDSFDLLILKEIISKMAGIEYGEDISDENTDCLAGGELLFSEAISMATNMTPLRKPPSIKRLLEALINTGMAIPLYVTIAQQRAYIAYKNDAPHLKSIGDMIDKCQETLLQYSELLITQLSMTQLSMIPSLKELIHIYALEPASAFHISRAILHERYFVRKSSRKTEEDEDKQRQQLIHTIKSTLPETIWQGISPELYTTFWMLTLSDIHFPRTKYDDEIQKQKQILDQMDHDPLPANKTKKEREKERNDQVQHITDLSNERDRQDRNRQFVMDRLSKDKNSWIKKSANHHIFLSTFLQHCIFPRCMWSVTDAVFCAKFVQILHNIGTPNFLTLQYFHMVLKDVTGFLYCCTEGEAARIGCFVRETLHLVERWRMSSDEVYQKECYNQPGFENDSQPPTKHPKADYDKACFSWHVVLTLAFTTLLESEEYMEVRNGLIVLTKIVSVFPILKRTHAKLEKVVNKHRKSEREDLNLLATRYGALLHSKEEDLLDDQDYAPSVVQLAAATISSSTGKDVSLSQPSAASQPPAHSMQPVTRTNSQHAIATPTSVSASPASAQPHSSHHVTLPASPVKGAPTTSSTTVTSSSRQDDGKSKSGHHVAQSREEIIARDAKEKKDVPMEDHSRTHSPHLRDDRKDRELHHSKSEELILPEKRKEAPTLEGGADDDRSKRRRTKKDDKPDTLSSDGHLVPQPQAQTSIPPSLPPQTVNKDPKKRRTDDVPASTRPKDKKEEISGQSSVGSGVASMPPPPASPREKEIVRSSSADRERERDRERDRERERDSRSEKGEYRDRPRSDHRESPATSGSLSTSDKSGVKSPHREESRPDRSHERRSSKDAEDQIQREPERSNSPMIGNSNSLAMNSHHHHHHHQKEKEKDSLEKSPTVAPVSSAAPVAHNPPPQTPHPQPVPNIPQQTTLASTSGPTPVQSATQLQRKDTPTLSASTSSGSAAKKDTKDTPSSGSTPNSSSGSVGVSGTSSGSTSEKRVVRINRQPSSTRAAASSSGSSSGNTTVVVVSGSKQDGRHERDLSQSKSASSGSSSSSQQKRGSEKESSMKRSPHRKDRM